MGIAERMARERRKRSEQDPPTDRDYPRDMFDHTPAVMLLVDPHSGDIVDANPAAVEFYGYDLDALRRMGIGDLVEPPATPSDGTPPDGAPPVAIAALVRHRLASGTVRHVEVYAAPVEIDGHPLTHLVIHDVTRHTQLEHALREGEDRNRVLLGAARRQLQEVALLDHVRTALSREVDLPAAFRTVVHAIAEAFGYQRVSIYLLDGDTLSLQHQVGYDHAVERVPLGEGVVGRVAGTGEPLLIDELLSEPSDIDVASDRVSTVCVPLLDQGHVVGVISIEGGEGVRLSDADFELMLATSEHINIAIGRARLYAEARESEHKYRSVVESINEVIFQVDVRGVWTFLNPAWTRITGYPLDASIGVPALDFIHPDDRARTAGCFRPLLLGDIDHAWQEARCQTHDGSPRWIEIRARLVRDGNSDVVGLSGVLTDVTERRSLAEQLTRQAFYDAVTSLPNRTLFLDRVGHALAASGRGSGQVAVLFLDLDGFKVINDSLGHSAGDVLLGAVGRRLASCMRPADTVARFGGDEFAVLLDHIHDASEAVRVAERIIQELRAPFIVTGREMFVGASIGITVRAFPATHVLPEDILREADIAMYRAKAGGKSRVVMFDTAMTARAVERLDVETDLRRALERDELEVYYQPEIDLETGRIVGMEALVRWRHPRLGLVAPAEFIPIAEETGQIVAIGQWVLEQACRQAHAWQVKRLGGSSLILSVNLSAREIERPNLVEDVDRVLRETGLAPSALRLEITETMLMEDGPGTEATLRRLHDLGVWLAIDDFGTGYSSLSYLRRFPVDTLKIDRSFIAAMDSDEGTGAIVRAVTALGHALGMDVIAEGIETAGHLARVRGVQCDRGQGYHFSRPVPANEMGELLAAGLGEELLTAASWTR